MIENAVGMIIPISNLIDDDDECRDDIISKDCRILFVVNNDECSSFVGRIISEREMVVETVFPAVDADVKVMFGGFLLEER
ncbi:hypothetical protein [Paramagnetospirillum magneticum]|uniref:hypothetical protein n=1 Tax=Paramagnetospirillum magneticum TaxID=84159 RepID=UPI001E37312F|nr:hypothetical protein [Paramagnetospirillum magneticum]